MSQLLYQSRPPRLNISDFGACSLGVSLALELITFGPWILPLHHTTTVAPVAPSAMAVEARAREGSVARTEPKRRLCPAGSGEDDDKNGFRQEEMNVERGQQRARSASDLATDPLASPSVTSERTSKVTD